MTIHCANINRKGPTFSESDRELLQKHGNQIYSKSHNLIRYALTREELESYLDVIPEVKPYLLDFCVSKTKLLMLHIHTGPKHTIINCYIETGDERTTFWEGEIVHDDTWVTDNGNGYWNVDYKILKPAQSYIAQEGEMWILNPFSPHSVLPDLGPELEMIDRMINMDFQIRRYKRRVNRRLVQMYFDLTPEEAVEKLNVQL